MRGLRKIVQEELILRLFRNLASQKEVSVSVCSKNKKIKGTMFFTARRGNEPSLRTYDPNFEILVGEKVEITFNNSEVLFFFRSEVTSGYNNSYTIDKPSILFYSFRRLMPRYRMSENDNGYVQFVNNERRYDIFDISSSGIAFISQDEKFTKGSIYRDIAIIINDDLKIYFDGEIKNIRVADNGEYIYGMNFINMELDSQNLFFLYNFKKIYPGLTFLKEASTQDILELYEKSHYFEYAYKDSQNILSCSDTYIKGFQDICQNSTITSGLVFYKSDKPLAMGSVVRTYNTTFIGHQVISLSETKLDTNPIKKVQSALCDFMINHSSFEYFISYIIFDFDSLLDYYIDVEGIINDNNKFKVDTLQCIECNCHEYTTFSETGSFECILLENTAEFVEFCKSKLSPIEFMSHSYNATQVQLTEIKQIYNALELFIDRRIWCIKDAGKVAAYAVAECYNDGINLFSSLDILRVYSTTGVFDISNIFGALIPQAIIFYQDNNKNVFYIHLDDEQVGAKDINIPGLNYRYPVGRIISNKEGVIEYKKFLNGGLISIPRQYKLTHPQLAIWYTEKVYPGTSFGNIEEMVIIKDKLDFTSLERAINQVIHNNIGIRLRFTEEDGEPRQYMVKYNYSNIEFLDFSQTGGFEGLYNWDEYKNGSCFKLLDSDLYYFAIFKVDDENCGFYIKTHHLISDAWTIANLLTCEIVDYYGLLKNNQKPSKELMPSYIDYILKEEEYKKSITFEEQKIFWNSKFNTIPELTNFKPTANIYRSTEAGRKTYNLSYELTSKLNEYCMNSNNSPFIMFMTILSIYIQRVTSKSDIVIATPVLNRSNVREKQTVGMFISVVPVRLNVNMDLTLTEYLKYINDEWKLILKNQKYPNDLILNDYRNIHKINDNLFDIVLSFQNSSYKELETEYEADWIFNGNQTESLAIHINDRKGVGSYTMDFDYLLSVFKVEEIERMFEHILNLLSDAIENPKKKLWELEILSEEERNKILYEFNDTATDYPRDKTIHQLFEEQAERTPDNVAVVFEDKKLTYRELNEKSNQVARILIDKGVVPDSIVGIMLDCSFEMFIGILGILKSGGAYLPIDPKYPSDRIQYMINDSNIKILLSKKCLLNSDISIDEIIDLKSKESFSGEVSNVNNINKSSDLAYIIYTSGSTGKPKGVMIEHKSLVNLCFWNKDYYKITESDRASKYAGSGFDASVQEMFPYLILGASIYIIPNNIKLDMNKLNVYFETNNISIGFLPTIICEQFLMEDNKSLRILITGGDKLKKFKQRRYELIDNYGPTENTVVSTSFIVNRIYSNIPIGRPIYNTEIYIIDERNNIQPIGLEGELCISGLGLARGYLNKPEITRDKFVKNPFKPNERMYKTGDLARWLSNGNIEFLGRIDHQVKIRGFRIELGEIENVLLRHFLIREAIIVMREDLNGNKYLCGYIIADNKIQKNELKQYLGKELPDYMIPAHFVQIERMPLTANGKVDKYALPEPDEQIKTGEEYVAPKNQKEELLAKIWQEVLGIEKVSINDNFFELGGDSIRAMQIVSNMQKNGLSVQMQDFFKYPNIKELSENTESIRKKINIKKVDGEVKLAPIQRWFFDSEFTNIHHFNQSVLLYRKSGFDIDSVKNIFSILTKHHDSLRMIYSINPDSIFQFYRGVDVELFNINVFDLRQYMDYEDRLNHEAGIIQNSINIVKGPLVKLGLFNTSVGDYLLIVIHHLVVDGVSWRIIFEDFAKAYKQASTGSEMEFSEKTDSFKEWAEKLSLYSNSKDFLKQIDYWMDIEKTHVNSLLKESITVRKKVKDSRSIQMQLSKEDTCKILKEVNFAYNTEINDILITALGLILKDWSGENKILINLEGHGREDVIEDINISRTVGWFTTMFPIILDLNISEDLSYQIKYVKENLRNVPNKGIGYGILKYLTSIENKNNVEFILKPEISFNYLGQFDQDIDSEVFTVVDLPVGDMISSESEMLYIFDIVGMVKNGILTFNFNYNINEFRVDEVNKIVGDFKDKLIQIINHCTSKSDKEFTPSDFGDSSLSLEELDEITDLISGL